MRESLGSIWIRRIQALQLQVKAMLHPTATGLIYLPLPQAYKYLSPPLSPFYSVSDCGEPLSNRTNARTTIDPLPDARKSVESFTGFHLLLPLPSFSSSFPSRFQSNLRTRTREKEKESERVKERERHLLVSTAQWTATLNIVQMSLEWQNY